MLVFKGSSDIKAMKRLVHDSLVRRLRFRTCRVAGGLGFIHLHTVHKQRAFIRRAQLLYRSIAKARCELDMGDTSLRPPQRYLDQ